MIVLCRSENPKYSHFSDITLACSHDGYKFQFTGFVEIFEKDAILLSSCETLKHNEVY